MRNGGDHRGSACSRRARKRWMLDTFGDGNTAPCTHCGAPLSFHEVEADRIEPGGSYARHNIQPSCGPCNKRRSNKPMEEFVLCAA
jgi:5-methylcytosine-specific restriction endonuclease McrA